MNKKSRYLMFALFALCVSLPSALFAAGKVNYNDVDLNEEQRVIESYIRDAESDLSYASSNVGRDMINSAWWYVTESGIKIDQARVLMKTHPQRIERCNIAWYKSEKTERQKLRDGHARLKKKLDKANGLLKAVEKDVGVRLGIDVGVFRDTLAILKALCENNAGSQYCDYFNRLKGLIEAGKADEAKEFARKITGEISNAVNDNNEIVKGLPEDVTVPQESDFGTTQNSTSTSNSAKNGNGSNTAPATTTPVSQVQGGANQGPAKTAGEQLSASEKQDLLKEMENVKQALSEYIVKTDSPEAKALMEELQKAIAAGDIDKVLELKKQIETLFGKVTVTEDGKLIFVLPNEITIVPAYIGEQSSGQLKLEKLYKLVASQDREGEYKSELLKTVEWQFVINPQMISSTGDSATYSLNLMDLNHNTDFKVEKWLVYNPDGSVNTEGTGNPLEVILSGNGDFRIIVEGKTEHDSKGSSFKIETIIRL